MTDTTSTTANTPTPKSNFKKFFWIVALILGSLGIDHYTFHWVSGGADVTVTDSTIVITPIVDTPQVVAPFAVDTVKSDTTKK